MKITNCGVARANIEQGNRFVDTSDDEIPDVSIPDQAHLKIEVVKLLTARNSLDKIDLAGKISTESQAPTDPFLDQLSKDLAEDEKRGPNISPHLVIVNNFGSKTFLEINSKIGCQSIQCQKIATKSWFQDAIKRS